ncbi:MAG TPA: PA0069 family radical SAM protein [Steroidobacteraceae bacterium]|jgi:DNA repair photolyase|nr:PA0069 family radical SAM protein [Steroidobacteraceae bacterium]
MVAVYKGRGALSNGLQRFQAQQTEAVDDGWEQEPTPDSVATTVTAEPARTVITYNESPDIGFDRSINPYRGCEHGCIYCYARPSHAYLGLSPGLDFETRLFFKRDAARLLEQELGSRSYVCRPIRLGANTDPYQPVEKRLHVTRDVLQVLLNWRHPVSIVTKSALILRDLDLLTEFAKLDLVEVMVSLTSLDAELKRLLEPRTASAAARLGVIRSLAAAGVPVGALIAPVIPVITDTEMESLLDAAVAAGASRAGYGLLRLPHELKDLFREWLEAHHPGKASHVLAVLTDLRAGKLNDSDFGTRMTGTGVYAQLLRRRFELARQRLGIAGREHMALSTAHFRDPHAPGEQLGFDLVPP